MVRVTKGDRFTNHLGKICVVKSVYRKIIKLQVLGEETYTEVWSLEDFNKCKTFFKIPMPKINRANIAKYLLEFQLNMIGRAYYETRMSPTWYDDWTISNEQFIFFKGYAIPLLMKTFKYNRTKANETFEWFNLQFGLKIK